MNLIRGPHNYSTYTFVSLSFDLVITRRSPARFRFTIDLDSRGNISEVACLHTIDAKPMACVAIDGCAYFKPSRWLRVSPRRDVSEDDSFDANRSRKGKTRLMNGFVASSSQTTNNMIAPEL
jgi:hypothetical protein